MQSSLAFTTALQCPRAAQTRDNTGCTPTLSWWAPAPSSFWLVKFTAGISINKGSQMVEGKKVGEKDREREASSRR